MEATKSLVSGERVNLTKDVTNPGQTKVELGWDAAEKVNGQDFDPDACLVLVHEDGTVTTETDLLFYNQNRAMKDGHPYEEGGKPVWKDATKPFPFILNGAITSSGDNLTGETDEKTVGDAKETITIDWTKIPATVQYAVPFVTIYDAKTRGQHFGEMKNAFIRISDTNNAYPAMKSDLTEDYSAHEAMIPGYFYKTKENEWKYVKEDIGINESAASLGAVPNVINVAENIIKLAKLKIGATA